MRAAAATDPALRPHLHAVSENWHTGNQAMLRAAQELGELDDDVAVPLLAEVLSALTLRRVMFQNPPVDDSIRADLHAPRPPPTPQPTVGGTEVLKRLCL